jgi:hypothetical protein
MKERDMALEFEWLVLSGFGSTPNIDGKQTGNVTVSLDMGQEKFYPEVEVTVLVDRRPEITWGEVEEQARDAAIEALKATVAALESANVEELRQRMIARRTAKEAADDEAMRQNLAEAFKAKVD